MHADREKGKKAKDPIGFWRIMKVAYPLVYRVCPVYFSVQQVISISHGLSWGLGVWASQVFFNTVADAVGKQLILSDIILAFAAFALTSVGQQVLNGIHNFMHGVVRNRLIGYTKMQIHKKSSRIPAISFEDPALLDDINKADNGAGNLFGFILIVTTIFTFYLPYFLFMAFFLYNVNTILIVSIVLAFIPSMASQLVQTRILARLEDKVAPKRREYESYEKAICDRQYFKETRILGAFGYFKRLFERTMKDMNDLNFRSRRKVALINLALNALSMIAYGVVLYLLVVLFLTGKITTGSFAAVFSSMGLLFSIMEEIVTSHIGNLSSNYGLIRNYIRFIEMPEVTGDADRFDSTKGIEIRNVTFRYPGTETDALKDVSLKIGNGETLAIVGENGSGKTTLVKMITGLYTPNEGTIVVGGMDTAEAAPSCLYESISGVFQKYQRYQLTLKENVTIARTDSGSDCKPVLEKAGVDFSDAETYPNSIDTMLSREFDGVDLSGGQWQRVAIARGFYREHELIVLDEPTAAIDPIEESRIYRQFAEIAQDKTAIIVTHRMGSARIADRIAVMDNGTLVEVGTHDELMESGGLYHKLYTAQSDWYSVKGRT